MARGLAKWFGGTPSPGRWLLLLVLIAAPAFAQVDLGAAEKLANGTVAYVLAVACVLLVGVSGYLFKALMDAKREHHAETVETLTAVVTLSLKLNEGFDVLEKAVDRFTEERR